MNKEYELLKKEININDKVILSCSGGPDSMCLLSLLLKLRKEKDFDIICAHVNHKKRKESEEEEEFVKKYCKENNVTFELLTLNNYEDNFQNSARKQRYDFLNKLQKQYNAKIVMTAHHGDDLIETILMRITRGTNLSGYLGFKQVLNLKHHKVLKPLITSDKLSILEYNKNNDIDYREDLSNISDDYTRNRYRKNILPFLKEENENIHLKYLNMSEKISEYDEFVKEYVNNLGVINNNKVDLITYNKQTKFIQDRILEEYISLIQNDNEFSVSDKTIFEINKLINSKSGKGTIDLSNCFKGYKENKHFFIQK